MTRASTAPAFARFLVASHRRAAENRARRPELAAQARRWSAVGAAAWLVVGRSPRGLAWWGLTVLMLDWHLGMVETESGEPRPLGPADACTLARSWLVPLAADRAAPLVVAAGFTLDAVDGPLARASAPTRAGRDLEGSVDAAFTVAALARRGTPRRARARGGHARSGEAGHRLRRDLRRLLRPVADRPTARPREPPADPRRCGRRGCSPPASATGGRRTRLSWPARWRAQPLLLAAAGLGHAVAGDSAEREGHHEVQAAAVGAAFGCVPCGLDARLRPR